MRSSGALACLALAAGCTLAPDLVARRIDGGAALSPAGDRCDDAIDGDGDRRIDEGCPCAPGESQACFGGTRAAQSTGVCAAGSRTCVSRGGEWGDWGDAECEDDRVPEPEQCDGLDHDCDGAIDEGCGCTPGARRACGAASPAGECRAGEQVCDADATWSGCAGAILPAPEICGDLRDQDCDAIADELCGCIARPEVCHDRIDNDCDGVTDEPACRPDWGTDGGVCLPETCDGTDEDCDGTIDDGCAATCACTLSLERALGEPLATEGHSLRWVGAARNDREGSIAAISIVTSGSIDELHFARWTTAGERIGGDVVLHRGSSMSLESFEWLGGRFLALGSETDADGGRGGFSVLLDEAGGDLRTFDGDRFRTAAARPHPNVGTIAVWPTFVRAAGATIAVWTECHAWSDAGFAIFGAPVYECTDTALFVQPVDDVLEPVGLPTRVTPGATESLTGAWAIAASESGELAIFGSVLAIDRAVPSEPTWSQRMALLVIRGAEVIARFDEAPFLRGGITRVVPAIAVGPERILACEAHHTGATGSPLVCRYASREGRPVGAPFVVIDEPLELLSPLSAITTTCGFALSVPMAPASGASQGHRVLAAVHPVDGSVTTELALTPIDPMDTLEAAAVLGRAVLRMSSDIRSCGTDCIRTHRLFVRDLACP